MTSKLPIEPLGTSRYTPLARIGFGGQAEILLALHHGDSGFERLVVIKRLLPHLVSDEDSKRRLQQEAQLVAQIQHPNVCQVLNLIDSDRGPLLVLEYLEGITLGEITRSLPRVRRLDDIRFLVGALHQACEGLHYAHELTTRTGQETELVHRDVSGNNVLVTREGITKVLDFGIAKASPAETTSLSIRGTAAFMSPEQVSGQELDRRADIFSLAVVAYEALTGRGLFRRANHSATFDAILDFEAPSFRARQPNVTSELEQVVLQNLCKDREGRASDARLFGEALADSITSIGGSMRLSEMAEYVKSNFASAIDERHNRVAAVAPETTLHPAGNSHSSEAYAPTQIARTPIQEPTETETLTFRAEPTEVADTFFDEGTIEALPQVQLRSPTAAPALGPDTDTTPSSADLPLLVGAPNHRMPSEVPGLAATGRRRRGRAWIVVLALLGAAGIVVAVAASGGGDSGARGASDAATAIGRSNTPPADAKGQLAVLPEAAPPDAASLPDARLAPDAAPPDAAPPEREAKRPRKREPRRPAGKPGFLTLDSRPFSTVYVDGRRVGRVPLYRVPLDPGKHRVRAVLDDGRKKSFTIVIKSGQDVRKRIRW